MKPLVEAVQNYADDNQEDANDALFFVLEESLKSENIKLLGNIKSLHECYADKIYEVDDSLGKKFFSIEMSTALKANANLTSLFQQHITFVLP